VNVFKVSSAKSCLSACLCVAQIITAICRDW